MMAELEEKNLQTSEADARYRSFIEIAQSAVVTCLQDGRIIITNRRAEELFGFSRKDILGKNIFDFITGEAARNELFATSLKDGRIRLVTENSIQTVRGFRGRLTKMDIAISVSEGDPQPLFTVILREIVTA
jgi:PAS domain S-box-containing protein